MKVMFLGNIARPDIDQKFSFLSLIVNDANEGDWKKVLQVMSFFKKTKNDVLALEVDNRNTLTWYISVSLAVQADTKIHAGSIITMRKGSVISNSTNLKVNLQSSTYSELIGMDEKIAKVL